MIASTRQAYPPPFGCGTTFIAMDRRRPRRDDDNSNRQADDAAREAAELVTQVGPPLSLSS
jgi:hypothetical protein